MTMEINGTSGITFPDSSVQSTAPTGVPSSLGVGDIVQMMYATSYNATLVIGTEIAGSNLRYVTGTTNPTGGAIQLKQPEDNYSVIRVDNSTFPTGGSIGTPSGTWRVMSTNRAGYSTTVCSSTTYYWSGVRMIRIS